MASGTGSGYSTTTTSSSTGVGSVPPPLYKPSATDDLTHAAQVAMFEVQRSLWENIEAAGIKVSHSNGLYIAMVLLSIGGMALAVLLWIKYGTWFQPAPLRTTKKHV